MNLKSMWSKKEERLNSRLTILLSRVFKNIHKGTNELLRSYDLTISQFAVLEALLNKGPLTVSEIIESILTTSGNMTVVIKNLEKKNLVKRNVNKKDKRSYLVSLTEEGRELIEEVFPKHMAILNENLDSIDVNEKEKVIEILEKIK